MQQLQHNKNNNNQETPTWDTKEKLSNGLNEALNAEATNNNEQQDMDMEDIDLSIQGTKPGENEYDDKFAESPSEFDSIILDA